MKKLVILIIFLLCLVPLIWFRDGRLIVGGDFSIPLSSLGIFKELLSGWYPNAMLGEPNFMQFSLVPWFGFWGLLQFIGFPLLIINMLWFIFIFSLTGFSMYFLISVVLEGKESWVVSLTASIFYLFNVFIMVVACIMATPLLYACLPLLLGLYLKGLQEEKSSNKYVLLIGLVSLLIASSIGNPPIYAIWLLFFFLCFVWHLVIGFREKKWHIFIFTFKTAVVYFLLNIWWLYPYASNVFVGQSLSRIDFASGGLAGSSLLDTFRLFGSWAFFATSSGAAYFPYAYLYKTPILLFLTFIPPIFAFGATLCRLKNKYFSFFLFTAFLGVMLATAAWGPTGAIYELIATNIPGFWIFREPFAKFTVITAISYAVLIGLTVGSIYQYILSRGRGLLAKVFVVAAIFVIVFPAWPIFTGDVIHKERGIMKSFHVDIPNYWFQAADWFNGLPGNFRVLVLPPKASNSYGDPPYKWGYGASDLVGSLITKPLVKEVSLGTGIPGFLPASKAMTEATLKLFQLNRKPLIDLQPILNMVGVEYILQRNDIDPVFVPDEDKHLFSPEYVKDILQNQKNIFLDKQFGELDVYKVSPSSLSPRIYSLSNLNLVVSKTNYLFSDSFNFPANVVFFNMYEKSLGVGKEADKNISFDIKNVLPNINQIYILGEIKDLEKEQKSKTMVVNYPQAKFRPGDVGYLFSLLKEEIDKNLIKDNAEKLFGLRLSLANKRLAEIDKFGKILNTAQTQTIIEDYKNEMSAALKTLDILKVQKPLLASENTGKLEKIIFTHRLKIDGIGLDDETKSQLRLFLRNTSGQIRISKSDRLSNILRYELDIPEDGKYEMYFGQEMPGAEFRIQKIGDKDLMTGKQEIELPLGTQSANLLDSEFRVIEYKQAAYYRLSFDYRSDNGGDVSVVEGKLGKKIDLQLPSTGKEFESFETMFQSSDDAVKAVVNVFVEEKRNVRLEKYFLPTLLLKKVKTEDRIVKPPNILFNKITPAEYRIKATGVSGPYILIFSESFHPGWKLTINGKTLPDSRHMLINGYANSWLVTPQDSRGVMDYEMTLEFSPNKLYKLFLIISLLTPIAFLVIMVMVYKKKK